MQNFTFMGRLTKDPETRSVGESSVCNFSVAISKKYKDKNGEQQEKTTFLNCAAWGKTGENIQKYMKKGEMQLFEGEIEIQKDKDYEDNKKMYTKVNINKFHFVPNAKKDGASSGDSAPAASGSSDLGAPDNPFQ